MFDPNSGPPGYVYVKLVEHLTALIDSGVLKPGARLLSERELARDCGVSLGTVRRAVGVLASRGLVRVVAAKGTYVVGPVSDD
ncbi:winged helix-turn-helix transcriptional regulator [Phytoactinopolyspora alkaliphila]|uniref:Winged helix-turn-helix transcriptional regulator n=1 Tax=Phytoactinopolyspora alkaliphila TaxID=1783498 RepID=A0A6N9YSM4_9ACTN|nr:winged helix-turn-helix domain-containing protein [Phytoactinopolyspora alkaliphila]NED97937.1 winged helix-turn-helix transcriptional regulator [Phytoactinopolyspora alkaliphila]